MTAAQDHSCFIETLVRLGGLVAFAAVFTAGLAFVFAALSALAFAALFAGFASKGGRRGEGDDGESKDG